MEYDEELYEILIAWTVSYGILTPIITILNYILSQRYGMRTIYEIYPKTSPLLVASSEYLYMTIIFVKTMYVYKWLLMKPTYYPRENRMEDYRDFILTYTTVQVIIDVMWTVLVTNISNRVHFLEFLDKYSNEFGIYSIMRPLIIGIILLLFTTIVRTRIGDLEGIGAVLFGLLFNFLFIR